MYFSSTILMVLSVPNHFTDINRLHASLGDKHGAVHARCQITWSPAAEFSFKHGNCPYDRIQLLFFFFSGGLFGLGALSLRFHTAGLSCTITCWNTPTAASTCRRPSDPLPWPWRRPWPSSSLRSALLPTTTMGEPLPPRCSRISSRSRRRVVCTRVQGLQTHLTTRARRDILQHMKLIHSACVFELRAVVELTVDEARVLDKNWIYIYT